MHDAAVKSDHPVVALELHPPISGFRRALRRTISNPTTILGLILVLLAISCALFAPLIAPYDPINGNLREYVQPPSPAHLFGTDDIGRDVFSRVVYGAQISIKLALAVQGLTLIAGLCLGLVGGFYGGWLDTIIMRIADIVMSFPLLIIAIALVGILGSSEANVIAALAMVSWPYVTRLTRSQVLSVKEQEYVTAARGLGATDFTLMFRHILPNLVTPVIVYITLRHRRRDSRRSVVELSRLGQRQPSAAELG